MFPEFVEIFNQSEAAEHADLKKICGPGYRKALEHLVKGYAKHINDETEHEKIDKMPMMQAINTYITHPSIEQLSKAAAWIGNDQTHAMQKHEDYSLEDLKRFVLAVAKYVDLELTTEQALELVNPH